MISNLFFPIINSLKPIPPHIDPSALLCLPPSTKPTTHLQNMNIPIRVLPLQVTAINKGP